MSENYQLHDFGRAAFGTLELKLSGRAGTVVSLEIGEVLLEGRINRVPGGFRCLKICTAVPHRDWLQTGVSGHLPWEW